MSHSFLKIVCVVHLRMVTFDYSRLEPQWKKVFFGSHYDRLLSIKHKVDPQNLFTCNRCVGSDL